MGKKINNAKDKIKKTGKSCKIALIDELDFNHNPFIDKCIKRASLDHSDLIREISLNTFKRKEGSMYMPIDSFTPETPEEKGELDLSHYLGYRINKPLILDAGTSISMAIGRPSHKDLGIVHVNHKPAFCHSSKKERTHGIKLREGVNIPWASRCYLDDDDSILMSTNNKNFIKYTKSNWLDFMQKYRGRDNKIFYLHALFANDLIDSSDFTTLSLDTYQLLDKITDLDKIHDHFKKIALGRFYGNVELIKQHGEFAGLHSSFADVNEWVKIYLPRKRNIMDLPIKKDAENKISREFLL